MQVCHCVPDLGHNLFLVIVFWLVCMKNTCVAKADRTFSLLGSFCNSQCFSVFQDKGLGMCADRNLKFCCICLFCRILE